MQILNEQGYEDTKTNDFYNKNIYLMDDIIKEISPSTLATSEATNGTATVHTNVYAGPSDSIYKCGYIATSSIITKDSNASNQAGLGADACLIELIQPYDFSINKIENQYGLQFYNAMIELLKNIDNSYIC